MHQYTKYILLRLIGPMALISFSLAAILWLAYSLRFIDLIVNRGLDVGTFLYLSSLLIPYILWPVIPIALFISVITVYQKMMADSELVALSSAGVSRIGLLKPALYFATVVMVIVFLIGSYFLPAAYREFKDMQTFIRDNYASLLLQEGVFTSPTEGFTVYIRERTGDGTLKGIVVHDSRKKSAPTTYMASEGHLVQGANGPVMMLDNGNRQQIEYGEDQFSFLFFERYALDLNFFTKNNLGSRFRKANERYLSELFSPTDVTNELQRRELIAEGHFRISWPLYCLGFTAFGVMSFVSGQYNRRGQPAKILLSIGMFITFLAAGFATSNIMTTKLAFVPLTYFLPCLALLAGLFACRYDFEVPNLSFLRKILPRRGPA